MRHSFGDGQCLFDFAIVLFTLHIVRSPMRLRSLLEISIRMGAVNNEIARLCSVAEGCSTHKL